MFFKNEKVDFKLIVLGERYRQSPKVFETLNSSFKKEILHFGYAEGFSSYAHWLWKADILPVTSNQDFFGGSVVEAIYCQNIPLLPNRLAYPEHIPQALQTKYIYNTPNDFKIKLKQAVLTFLNNNDKQRLSDFVAQYDWGILAQQYDRTFQDTFETKGKH